MTDAPSDPSAPHSVRALGRQQVARRRDDLRKAALKANMARRKAQVRGRGQTTGQADASGTDPADDPDTDTRNT